MLIKVSHRTWRIRVASEALFTDGNEASGLCDYENCEIAISKTLSKSRRIEVVRLGYFTAVFDLVPFPKDEEDMAILFATYSEQLADELEHIGGNAAIEALRPTMKGEHGFTAKQRERLVKKLSGVARKRQQENYENPA